MTKKSFVSIVLALLLALSGIAAIAEAAPAETTEETPETPEATPVPFNIDDVPGTQVLVTVDGSALTKDDVMKAYDYYAQQYAAYGMDFTDGANQKMLLQYVTMMSAQAKVIENKSKELGFDQFTAEEEAEFRVTAQSNYDYMVTMYQSSYKTEGKSDEDAKAEAEKYLNEQGYTVDALIASAKSSETYNRVTEMATKDVVVTDEDVKAAYDAAVAQAKASYDASLTAYETDKNGGKIIYYTPEGFRAVKHILVQYENAAKLKELKGKLDAMAADDAERETTQSEYDKLMAEIQPKLDEIQTKIDAGEDFQALIDQYGEDGGMKAGSANAETGYFMCKDTATYVPEFTAAGMALAKVGDVSAPVLTDYGFHFVQYFADVPAGVTEFDEIKDDLRKELETTKDNEAVTALMSEWVSASTIEVSEF